MRACVCAPHYFLAIVPFSCLALPTINRHLFCQQQTLKSKRVREREQYEVTCNAFTCPWIHYLCALRCQGEGFLGTLMADKLGGAAAKWTRLHSSHYKSTAARCPGGPMQLRSFIGFTHEGLSIKFCESETMGQSYCVAAIDR